jgi:hypothetical protein
MDSVRDLFNETSEAFLSDEFILRSINRCLQDLAQEDYWRKESWVPASAGVNQMNLTEVLPDYQSLHQVRFSGRASPMVSLGSYKEYDELRAANNSPGIPEYYVVQNNTLFVWPPPAEDLPSGFCLYHSYSPADLTCSPENPDPLIPKAHDMVFVYFVLQQAFLRDRHAPGADSKFQEYSTLYEREKQRLLAEGEPPALAVRPGR